MMLAPGRPFRSPTKQSSNENQSSLISPPRLSPRRIGSDSITSRTLMVPQRLTPSLFLPMDLEQADDRSFRRSLLAFKPRNESSADQTAAAAPAPVPTPQLVQTQTTSPVLVTPRCQPHISRKRQRHEDSDSEEDEELTTLNVPKKLMLCLDD